MNPTATPTVAADPHAHTAEAIRQLATARGLFVSVATPDSALTAAGVPAANITGEVREWVLRDPLFQAEGRVYLYQLAQSFPECWIDTDRANCRWGLSFHGGWHALPPGIDFHDGVLGGSARSACGAEVYWVDSPTLNLWKLPARAADPTTSVCTRCEAKAGPIPASVVASVGGAR